MSATGSGMSSSRGRSGLDGILLRLAIFGVVVIACFVALFSRLWFLQVLAVEDYRSLAKENRVRFIYSEPPRGRILDRNQEPLVVSHKSLAVTVDRQVVDTPAEQERTLTRLSKLLDEPIKELREGLTDATVSPYKPVAVAYGVHEKVGYYIGEHQQRFRGVATELLPVRRYPLGSLASQLLGYVGEISQEELDSDFAKGAKPAYEPGDIVGKLGLERSYDRLLRGRPRIEKVIVNSSGDVVGTPESKQVEEPGKDIVLSLDAAVQKLTEDALSAGLQAARVRYRAPAGAAVVLDPNTGAVVAMASEPDYNPAVLADGISQKEFDALGAKTAADPDDDALLNRAIQAQRQPGSTFKIVTAGAALATGIADAFSSLPCPGSAVYPPEGGPGSVLFRNWTSTNFGVVGFPESLEISCDTFYYELGWRLEEAFGAERGDGTEKFQDYARAAGIGHETGIDLPNEADGRVPDEKWCLQARKDTEHLDNPTCPFGWLPGYTVNMSIGQGDLIVTPMQMAVTYAAVANGGNVMQPRLVWALTEPDEETGEPRTVKEFAPRVVEKLPLDATEIGVIQQGLEQVIAGEDGTARGAFAGFPLDQFPIAGKTGTAELGETALNDAWFVAYGPSSAPQYVVAVYLEKAGHGGESAAPIARQIFEGIFGLDQSTSVRLGQDFSG